MITFIVLLVQNNQKRLSIYETKTRITHMVVVVYKYSIYLFMYYLLKCVVVLYDVVKVFIFLQSGNLNISSIRPAIIIYQSHNIQRIYLNTNKTT